MKKPLAIFRFSPQQKRKQWMNKTAKTHRNHETPTTRKKTTTKNMHPGKLVFCGSIGFLGIIFVTGKNNIQVHTSTS